MNQHFFKAKISSKKIINAELCLIRLSVNEWKELFKNNQFKNIEINFFGSKDDWNGTLILYAEK